MATTITASLFSGTFVVLKESGAHYADKVHVHGMFHNKSDCKTLQKGEDYARILRTWLENAEVHGDIYVGTDKAMDELVEWLDKTVVFVMRSLA